MQIIYQFIVPILFCSLLGLSLVSGVFAQPGTRQRPIWDWEQHHVEILGRAKNSLVSTLERGRPQIRFIDWFQKSVGGDQAEWRIADCADLSEKRLEQRKHGVDICVVASARLDPAIFLEVYVNVGTFKNGVRARPVIRSIFYGDDKREDGAFVTNLAELIRELRRIRKAQEFFDPDSGVFMISDRRSPAGLEDFNDFWLATTDVDSRGRTFPVKKYGGVYAAQKTYKFEKIFFDGKKISFDTMAIDSVSYSFNGKFNKPKLNSHGSADSDNVLTGRLVRLVNGIKTAEAELTFNFYFEGE